MAASLWKSSWAVLPAICVFVAAAHAQSPPPAPPTTPPDFTAQKPITVDHPPMLSADRDIAEMLAIDNQGEVAMAKLADSKAQTSIVRLFAERMVDDHTKMLQELRPFKAAMNMAPTGPTAGGPNTAGTNAADLNATTDGPAPAGRSTVAGTPSTPAAPGTAGTPSRAPLGSTPTPGSTPNSSTVPTPGGVPVPSALPGAEAPRTAAPSATARTTANEPQAWAQVMAGNQRGGIDFLQVERQIKQQCLASATKEWDSKKAAEVEIAFIGQQIVAHQHMIDTSKVLRQYASPRLQSLIDQGARTAESHLSEARELMATLTQKP
jgi:predicted outer membrane protein